MRRTFPQTIGAFKRKPKNEFSCASRTIVTSASILQNLLILNINHDVQQTKILIFFILY
jgi:hypothetical protein